MARAIFWQSMMGFRTTTRLTSIWFSVPLPLFSFFLTPSLVELYLFFSLPIFLSLHPSHTAASFFFSHSSGRFTPGYSTFLPNSVVVLAEFGSLASVASYRAHYWVSRFSPNGLVESSTDFGLCINASYLQWCWRVVAWLFWRWRSGGVGGDLSNVVVAACGRC